mmetsp:Transcript_16844/g.23180  ORF Transcript_16844/g.23180 Transcript_16844/m.23180 type:complete len:215 (+) Transcript_16844:230-874(+)
MLSLYQHRLYSTHISLRALQCVGGGEALEPLQPVLLHLLRNLLLLPAGRGGEGPGRVGVGEQLVELDLLHEPQGVLELLFRLAGESHDAVRCDGRVGHLPPNELHDAQVPLAGVAPPHLPQHLVVSALEGHVEVGHDDRVGGHRLHHPRGHVLGVAGEEAQSLQARHGPHRGQQVGEALLGHHVAAPGVDVLPQQRDLLPAGPHQLLHLAHHRL